MAASTKPSCGSALESPLVAGDRGGRTISGHRVSCMRANLVWCAMLSAQFQSTAAACAPVTCSCSVSATTPLATSMPSMWRICRESMTLVVDPGGSWRRRCHSRRRRAKWYASGRASHASRSALTTRATSSGWMRENSDSPSSPPSATVSPADSPSSESLTIGVGRSGYAISTSPCRETSRAMLRTAASTPQSSSSTSRTSAGSCGAGPSADVAFASGAKCCSSASAGGTTLDIPAHATRCSVDTSATCTTARLSSPMPKRR
ncbi:hypothetical protein GGI13_006282 [Coemansia sp. RSA 455]|nr:hypothetical protein GGI13_006282 [Coemansia sp. RSA 455]